MIKTNKEYENLVPPITKEMFESLVSSIRANGQHEPITVNGKGEVLDGHNRLKACELLKIEPVSRVKTFPDLLHEKLYVIDANLQRRQLTDAQRVQLSLKKKPILQEIAKLNQSLGGRGVQICTPLGRVNEVIAKDSGVSARQVSKIQTILEKAPEDLKNRVLTGITRVDKAYRKVRKEERRAELVEKAARANLAEAHDNELFQLIEGDVRDPKITSQLKDSSIDLIFTDPPYDEKSLPLYADLAKMADRVLKEGGSLVTNAGHYALLKIGDLILANSNDLTYWWTLCVKHNGASARMHGQQVYVAWKPLLWFVKGTKLATPDYRSDFIESKQPEKILHELEQSPKEAEHVIEWLTVEGQTVIDPFCGSGTTALAALKLRRRFVGIDINPIALNSARTNIKLNLQLITEAV